MCGIAGEIAQGRPADLTAIGLMTDAMVPRGPDGSGAWASERVAFGHRRLAIIDLSSHGHQPMHDPELGLTVAFNGCIYNYPELRQQLIGLGYRFFSHSDTEVILKGYREWGERVVDHLKGMFAFAVAETDTGRVVLARDRLGVKPLYWCDVNEGGGDGRAAVRVVAARAGRGGRRRHRDRPRRPAPLPELPLRRARAAHDPARASASSRRARSCGSSPTARERRRRTGSRCSSGPPSGPTGRSRTGRTRSSPRCAPRWNAAWSPTCPSVPAVGRPGLQPHRRSARRGGTARPADVLDRFRGRRWRGGRRVQVLRRHRAPLRHRPSPDPHRHRPDAAVAVRRHRRDERTHGEPRLRGVLPAVRRGQQARQGGAVGAGRRRDLRRLPLVPADGARRRRRSARRAGHATGRRSSTATTTR